MALVVPNVAEDTMLQMILKAGNCTLRLFTNDRTPAASDTLASYTEASGNGYGAITLTAGSWSITQGAPSTASYAQQTFSFSGALGAVYGYYVTRNSDGALLFAERFTSPPYVISSGSDTIKVTLQFTLKSNTND